MRGLRPSVTWDGNRQGAGVDIQGTTIWSINKLECWEMSPSSILAVGFSRKSCNSSMVTPSLDKIEVEVS